MILEEFLYNRAYLNKYLMNNKSYPTIAVFSFDIDKLKYTNDTFGHAVGDNLIRSSAAIIKYSLRDDDLAIRMGGDEFIAILPNCNMDMAKLIEQRIRSAIKAHRDSIAEKIQD